MNQILVTDLNKDKDAKKKNNRRQNNNNDYSDIKKIIMFFAIVIIVFGISLTGVYGYKLYNNIKGEPQQEVVIPELSLESYEEIARVTIIAKSKIGLDKIIYSWNDEAETVVQLAGRKSQEEGIDIPDGESILNVRVIDINGEEATASHRFSLSVEKPKIETSVIEDGKLKITATAENFDIKYILYKWNDEQEVRVNQDTDSDSTDNKLEEVIDIKRGKNVITITAVASNNGKETITKTFNGVNNPEIEVTRGDDKLYIKVSHDIGIKKIEYNMNNDLFIYDENARIYNPDKKELEFYYNLREGENMVVITATSTEDTEAVYRGKCVYVKSNEEQ